MDNGKNNIAPIDPTKLLEYFGVNCSELSRTLGINNGVTKNWLNGTKKPSAAAMSFIRALAWLKEKGHLQRWLDYSGRIVKPPRKQSKPYKKRVKRELNSAIMGSGSKITALAIMPQVYSIRYKNPLSSLVLFLFNGKV